MTTPTKEELGLPWEAGYEIISDSSGRDILECQGDGSGDGTEAHAKFSVHAANTYHEREQLLRECLTVIAEMAYSDVESPYGCRDCGTVDKLPHEKDCRIQEILNEISVALTPPSPPAS